MAKAGGAEPSIDVREGPAPGSAPAAAAAAPAEEGAKEEGAADVDKDQEDWELVSDSGAGEAFKNK
jgi:hypothetical protein